MSAARAAHGLDAKCAIIYTSEARSHAEAARAVACTLLLLAAFVPPSMSVPPHAFPALSSA